MFTISIPTPCHEDWDAMIPNAQGRHCNTCVKTVVDFTGMSDEELKHFFLNKKEEKICGRFRTEQLHRITIELPQNIFYIRMPVWKKFLAACLLVFSTTLFSCDTKVTGDVTEKNEYVKSNTVGVISKPKSKIDTSLIQVTQTCTVTQGSPGIIMADSFSQGDINVVPVPPQNEIGIIEVMPEAVPADTAVAKNNLLKKGEVLIKKDSITLAADTCNHSTFY